MAEKKVPPGECWCNCNQCKSGSHMYPNDAGGTTKHAHEVYCNAFKP
jgi:hypothetical protein